MQILYTSGTIFTHTYTSWMSPVFSSEWQKRSWSPGLPKSLSRRCDAIKNATCRFVRANTHPEDPRRTRIFPVGRRPTDSRGKENAEWIDKSVFSVGRDRARRTTSVVSRPFLFIIRFYPPVFGMPRRTGSLDCPSPHDSWFQPFPASLPPCLYPFTL